MKIKLLLCAAAGLMAFQLAASDLDAKEHAGWSVSKTSDKKAVEIKISAPFSKNDGRVKEPVARKLVELILKNGEDELNLPPLNPEEDVTDNDSGEGKTYLNQTAYLRKAGIDPEKMTLGGSPEDTIKKTLENARLRYYTSLADIDNDGEKEIRFYSVQGSLMQEDNYFFKKGKDGSYKLIECGLGCEKTVGFIKFENKTYTIERNQQDRLKTLTVYVFENDKFKRLFTLDIGTGQKKKTVTLTEDASNN